MPRCPSFRLAAGVSLSAPSVRKSRPDIPNDLEEQLSLRRSHRNRLLVIVSAVTCLLLSTMPAATAGPGAGKGQPVDSHGNPVARPVQQPKFSHTAPPATRLTKNQIRTAGTTLQQAQAEAERAQGANARSRGKPPVSRPPAGVSSVTAGDQSMAGMDMSGMDMSSNVTAPAAIQGPTNIPSATGGQWNIGPTLPSPSIHSVLLDTGKVLIIAGSANQYDRFAAGTFTSSLWDPQTNILKAIATPHDMFCAGHVILQDGRVLVSGGTTAYPVFDASGNLIRDWKGSKKSYIFDPIKEIYLPTDDLNVARWYPSLARMGNNQVVAVGGLDDGSATSGGVDTTTNEIFTPNAGSTWDNWAGGHWSILNTRGFPQYAHMILTAAGDLFYTGESTGDNGQSPGLWQPYTNTFSQVAGLPNAWQRNAGASVLLPPAQSQKVIVIGGGDYSLPTLNDTHVVDLNAPNPGYVDGPPIANAKMYVGAITLPDYTVLQTNGASQFRQNAVRDAQIYDPAANTWTTVNSPTIDRLYHSSALLLPDGRVATLGSQVISGANELRMEIYSPPYLFKGQRPTINAGPTWIDYDTANHPTWDVTTADGSTVSKVSLVRPSATTHSTDTEQRLVDLPFTTAAGKVSVSVPTNRNLAPPGWYMLTVLDSQGRPSVAKWVSLN